MLIKTKKVILRLKQHQNLDKDSDLAKAMGVNRATFSSWLQRDSINYEILLDFCKKKSISLDWLFELDTKNLVREENAGYSISEISEIDEIKNRLIILEDKISKIIKKELL